MDLEPVGPSKVEPGLPLDGVLEGTDLGHAVDVDSVIVTSSTGENTDIPSATGSTAGVLTAADWQKLQDLVLNPTAAQIPTDTIGDTDYDDVQRRLDLLLTNGVVDGCAVTTPGANLVDVAAGNGLLRVSDSPTAGSVSVDVPATTSIAIANGEEKTVVCRYNAGVPDVVLVDVGTAGLDTLPIGIVEADPTTGVVTVLELPLTRSAANLLDNLMARIFYTMRGDREYGVELADSTDLSRNVVVSAGRIWYMLDTFLFSDYDSATTDVFDTYAQANLIAAAQSAWNNTQYDNGTGTLATLTNNRWGNHWVYWKLDGSITLMFGTSDAQTQDQALAETPPLPTDLPDALQDGAILIGRYTFQKDASTANAESWWDDAGGGGAVSVTDHGELTGRSNADQHPQAAITDLVTDQGTQDTRLTDLETAKIPAGGTTGQVLAKASGTDYDDEWIDNASGTVDLGNTPAPTGVEITNTGGANTTLGLVDTVNAGLNSPTDKVKLDGIESGATADQTDAEIRTAVQNATDSNVFTDALLSKLSAIEPGATGDQTGAEIKVAYEGEANTNAFTDAEQSKLSGVESGATADQTDTEIRTAVQNATDSNVFTDAYKTSADTIGDKLDKTGGTMTGELVFEATKFATTDLGNSGAGPVSIDQNANGRQKYTVTGAHTLNVSNFAEGDEVWLTIIDGDTAVVTPGTGIVQPVGQTITWDKRNTFVLAHDGTQVVMYDVGETAT